MCFGDAAGSLEVDVSGGIKKEISAGVFDYVYNWSGPNGYASTSKNIDNLFAGTYTLNVIDDGLYSKCFFCCKSIRSN